MFEVADKYLGVPALLDASEFDGAIASIIDYMAEESLELLMISEMWTQFFVAFFVLLLIAWTQLLVLRSWISCTSR